MNIKNTGKKAFKKTKKALTSETAKKGYGKLGAGLAFGGCTIGFAAVGAAIGAPLGPPGIALGGAIGLALGAPAGKFAAKATKKFIYKKLDVDQEGEDDFLLTEKKLQEYNDENCISLENDELEDKTLIELDKDLEIKKPCDKKLAEQFQPQEKNAQNGKNATNPAGFFNKKEGNCKAEAAIEPEYAQVNFNA